MVERLDEKARGVGYGLYCPVRQRCRSKLIASLSFSVCSGASLTIDLPSDSYVKGYHLPDNLPPVRLFAGLRPGRR